MWVIERSMVSSDRACSDLARLLICAIEFNTQLISQESAQHTVATPHGGSNGPSLLG